MGVARSIAAMQGICPTNPAGQRRGHGMRNILFTISGLLTDIGNFMNTSVTINADLQFYSWIHWLMASIHV